MKAANAQCQVCGARAIFRGQDVVAIICEIDRRFYLPHLLGRARRIGARRASMTKDDTKRGELTMSLFDPRITAWHARIARAVRHGWHWGYTQAHVAVLYRLSHGRCNEIALEQ